MSGQEALNIIEKNVNENKYRCSYELILMDCNMPIMDGYQTTENIREFIFSKGLQQPLIIAITGHTEQTFVQRAINSGMNMVFSKPVNKELLVQILKLMEFYD